MSCYVLGLLALPESIVNFIVGAYVYALNLITLVNGMYSDMNVKDTLWIGVGPFGSVECAC